MGIDVAIVNERHEIIQFVDDGNQYITSLAMRQWSRMPETRCVRFIDVCGDAVFNQLQIPTLLQELQFSCTLRIESKVKAHLEKVCKLVSQAEGKVHTYIKFIGD
jgi:hypothetical protein